MDYRLKKINFFDLPIGTIFAWYSYDNNIAGNLYYIGVKTDNGGFNNALCIEHNDSYKNPLNLTIAVEHFIEIPGKTIIV